MNIRVERLTARALQAYRALMLEAYASVPDAFTSTAQERALAPEAWWIRRLDDPSGLSLVLGAWQGEALVGTVALEFSDRSKLRHKGHVIGLYVQPVARGQGVAAALMAQALECARQRPGLLVLTLTVTEGNRAAESLYRSFGFDEFGLEPMAIATPEGFRAKRHLWCRLTPGG